MPMPRASAAAIPNMPGSPPDCAAIANKRPTLIPSGMLCSVTAVNSKVGRFHFEGSPSGSFSPGWRWGKSACRPMRNATPSAKPPAAGIHPIWPASSAASMAGMSNDHTEAAIMTPAANPRNSRCMVTLSRLRNKNTAAAPSVVMRKVNPVPAAAHVSASCNAVPPVVSILHVSVRLRKRECASVYPRVTCFTVCGLHGGTAGNRGMRERRNAPRARRQTGSVRLPHNR